MNIVRTSEQTLPPQASSNTQDRIVQDSGLIVFDGPIPRYSAMIRHLAAIALNTVFSCARTMFLTMAARNNKTSIRRTCGAAAHEFLFSGVEVRLPSRPTARRRSLPSARPQTHLKLARRQPPEYSNLRFRDARIEDCQSLGHV